MIYYNAFRYYFAVHVADRNRAIYISEKDFFENPGEKLRLYYFRSNFVLTDLDCKEIVCGDDAIKYVLSRHILEDLNKDESDQDIYYLASMCAHDRYGSSINHGLDIELHLIRDFYNFFDYETLITDPSYSFVERRSRTTKMRRLK